VVPVQSARNLVILSPPPPPILPGADADDIIRLGLNETKTVTASIKQHPSSLNIQNGINVNYETDVEWENLNPDADAAVCTINTNVNYTFKLKDKASLRGYPFQGVKDDAVGGPYYVYYDVTPEKDTVESNWQYLPAQDNVKQMMTVEVDKDLQRIKITPLKAGYGVLTFQSLFNRDNATGHDIINLPVYFYYPTIDFEFVLTRERFGTNYVGNPPILHSKIDNNIAILLADGEKVTLRPSINGTKYPNSGLTVTGVTFERNSEIGDGVTIDNPGFSPASFPTEPYGWVNLTASGAGLQAHTGYETKSSVVYAGLLKIQYSYFNGNQNPASFTKTFIVYVEKWRRP
jgi:hypothetical protein